MERVELAAAAIFRDEAAFLPEWIEFHRMMGVGHFFLYDNGSSDEPERALAPYLEDGVVTLTPWPVPFHQHAARKAYADGLERCRGRARWFVCMDIDEFVFAPEAESILPVLADYEQYPGVVVRWQVYGSAGQERHSDQPVIGRFTRRAPRDWIRNRRVKSIVDPERTLRPVNAHHFEFRDGALAVTETGEAVRLRPRHRLKKRLRPLYRLLGPALQYFDPYAATDVSSRSVSVERLRINHYPIKSREDFLAKARFKKEKKRYEGIDYFAYHDRNDVHDPILTRYLPELERRLRAHRARVA